MIPLNRILTVQKDWIYAEGLNQNPNSTDRLDKSNRTQWLFTTKFARKKKKEKLRSDLDIYRKLKDALTSLNYGIKFHYIVRLLTQN